MTKPAYTYDELDEIFRGKGDDDTVGMSLIDGLIAALVAPQGSDRDVRSNHRLRWFYLSTILDDFSRYIIAWKLCTTMKAEDVTDTLELALTPSGCESAQVAHRPRLLSDNGSSYIAGDLAEWLEDRGIKHIRGAPFHPQTQGKIERWHQTLKNRILLENYSLPG